MNLKFIGTDGYKGLKHGETYEVLVRSHLGGPVIWVSWFWMGVKVDDCPYSSPTALAADWVKPGQPQKVIVRKKTAIEDSDTYSTYKRAIKRMKTVTLLDLFLAGFRGGEKRD